ncbi:MAG: ArsR family transcriptional regulator, partial [Actinomycetales bacterium]|nr:ArsR family transcriptional regulator [Actinomycetales bacterium]
DGDDLAKDSETRPAVAAMLRNQVTQRAEALQDWFQRSEDETERWRQSSINARSTAKLTAQEATDLNRALMETIHEHTEAAKARHEAADSADETRQVRLYLDVFPLPAEDQ